MDDLLREFLTETTENLDNLDIELMRLEQEPNDRALISNIFRLVHTIKGTCGFLGLPRLEAVAHAGENVLGRFRDGTLEATPAAVGLILEAIDAIKDLLAALEETGTEPEGDDSALIAQLDAMAEAAVRPVPKPPTTVERTVAPLIERVGGLSAIDAAVELAYRKILKDPNLAPLLENADLTLLQGCQVEYLAAALGGPADRSGDPDAIHRPLVASGLDAGHLERAAAHFRESLAALEVPPDAIDEVLAVLGPIRDRVPRRDAPAAPRPPQPAAAQSIRVGVDLLENLMTMVSELVLSRNQLLQMVRKYEDSEFTAPLQRLSLITSDLQEGVMKTRMQPIGNAWSKLPRIVRDLSHELGKKIDLEMKGAETELDRQVLELVKDPLTHMVRNSADHGIERPDQRIRAGKPETGRVVLDAYHQGGHIIIEIADDGRGIPVDKLRARALANGLATEAELAAMSDKQIMQFIFKPGFSTAERVTNVSGRGVGMDVVRTNIEKIGGHVELKSVPGKGSVFIVKIPITLAIVSALIVACAGERFAIPQIGVDELVRVTPNSEPRIETINDTPVLRLRDRLLPLVALDAFLELRPKRDLSVRARATDAGAGVARQPEETYVVVARVGTNRLGIVVDQVFESEEIVVKPVTPVLRGVAIFSGNTILGDGSVIMILDPNGIAAAIGASMVGEGRIAEDAPGSAGRTKAAERTALLVFRAGGPEPLAVPLALVARLEEIDVWRIEETSGHPVVQYRGRLMPLVSIGSGFVRATAGRQHVIVFGDGGHAMGLMVDEILDIVDERLDVQLASKRPGVLGTAVVAGRATEVIEAAHYLETAFGGWFDRRGPHGRAAGGRNGGPGRVLLVDDSPFFRNLLTPLLSVAGYQVTAVEDAERALRLRDSGEAFDAIISDIEMPGMDGFDLARTIRDGGAWRETPLFALSARASPADLARGRAAGFTGYIAKLDRDALLQSLSTTLSGIAGAA